jgi:PKD repeat protein
MNNWRSYSILLLFWFVLVSLSAQVPDWSWAKQAGGSSVDDLGGVSVYAGGYIYVTGYFMTSATFGTTTLTSNGQQDLYVAKLDTSGNWIWAKKANGTAVDISSAIAADAAGNVYITGYFNSTTLTFGSYTINRTSGASYNDAFLAKIDANGNWQWAKKFGGTSTDTGIAVTVDQNSNVIFSGSFRNTVTVDTTPVTTMTSSGWSDIFVAKLSATGTWIWAKKAGGTSYDNANSVVLDGSGNIFLSGGFNSTTAVFDTITVTNTYTETYDVFVAKLNSNGNWLWVRKAGGNGSDTIYSSAMDTSGALVITGGYSATASFGATTLPFSGGTDIFVAKIDGAGSWIWAKKAGGSNTDIAWKVLTDIRNAVYISGQFTGTATFGTTVLTSPGTGTSDGYVAQLSSGGAWIYVKQLGGISDDIVTGMEQDPVGNLYIGGSFTGNMVLGATTLTSSSGSQDIFIARLGSASLRVNSPNGGETWISGSIHPITWDYLAVTSVFIDYSLDNGSTWTQINTTAVSANLGVFDWTVPTATSTNCLVRIRNSANSSVFDVSDGNFSIGTSATPPQANFTANITSGTAPLTVQFTDASTPGSGTLTTWSWSFGDTSSSSLQNPSHQYQNAGTYSVSLTVTNSFNLSHTFTRTGYITVQAPLPQLNLLTPQSMDFGSINVSSQSAYQPVTVQNTGQATLVISSVHFIGAALNFQYQLPARNISIVPGASGTIQVRFTPTAVGALLDTLFVVNNSPNLPLLKIRLTGTGLEVFYPPQPAFTANVTSGLTPLSVQFTDQSVPVSGTITSWTWSFGDGGSSSQQSPLYIYQNAGVFDVSLTVVNSHSLSATLTRDDYISVSASYAQLNLLSNPSLTFGSVILGGQSAYQNVLLQSTGTIPLVVSNVHFYSSVGNFEYLNPGTNQSISPGSTGSVQVRFTPQTEGAITDTLYIVNNSLNHPLLKIALAGTGLPIYNPPQAGFTANPTSGTVPLIVQFSDQSVPVSGSLISWLWNFGDNSTGAEQNPQHTYLVPGNYTISLTVTNSHNLSATFARSNYISVANPDGHLNLLSEAVVSFGNVYLQGTVPARQIRLSNSGNRNIAVSSIHFLSEPLHFQFVLPPDMAILQPGETDTILVRCSPQTIGALRDTLFIVNDSDNMPLLKIRLLATGQLAPPQPPGEMNIILHSYDTYITWEPVTQNIAGQPCNPEFYLVFVNGTNDLLHGFVYLGMTTDPNYMQHYAALYSPRMFYRVRAVEVHRGEYAHDDSEKGKLTSLKRSLKPGMSENEVADILASLFPQITSLSR